MTGKYFLLALLLALAITSCASFPPDANLVNTQTSEISTLTPNGTRTPGSNAITPSLSIVTSEPALISTLWPYPTPRAVPEYPDQVTDGILLFSIEAVDNICYSVGEPIKIRAIFSNISDRPIDIAADFYVAPSIHGVNGNLLPYITTANGERLYRPGDFSYYDTFPPTPDTFVTIPAKHTFSTVIDYFFSSSFVTITPVPHEILNTPETGQYFVKFSYVGYEKDANTWFGIVGSNRISICIQ